MRTLIFIYLFIFIITVCMCVSLNWVPVVECVVLVGVNTSVSVVHAIVETLHLTCYMMVHVIKRKQTKIASTSYCNNNACAT